MYHNTLDDPEKHTMPTIDSSKRCSTRRRQSSRDRRYDARRIYGVYIIENARAGIVEDNNAVKFNCEENLHRVTCVYFEGEPKNNKQANFTVDGIPELHDENDRMTPGYIDFTNNMQFIEGVETKSNDEKELKIENRVTQQVHQGDPDVQKSIQERCPVQSAQVRNRPELRGSVYLCVDLTPLHASRDLLAFRLATRT